MLEHKKKQRTPILKNPSSRKDIKISLSQSKKPPTKKKMKYMTQQNNAKDQMERKERAAAAEAESTLVDAVAQETERRSMKRSSKAANQRGWYSSTRAWTSGRVDVYTRWK